MRSGMKRSMSSGKRISVVSARWRKLHPGLLGRRLADSNNTPPDRVATDTTATDVLI